MWYVNYLQFTQHMVVYWMCVFVCVCTRMCVCISVLFDLLDKHWSKNANDLL